MKEVKVFKIGGDDDENCSEEWSESPIAPKSKIKGYRTLAEAAYSNPNPSIQDGYTKEDIIKKIQGRRALGPDELHELLEYKSGKIWIKYFNRKLKKFRNGGLLVKVDPELQYVVVIHPSMKLTWTVNLQDNILFVPNKEQIIKKEEEKTPIVVVQVIKEGGEPAKKQKQTQKVEKEEVTKKGLSEEEKIKNYLYKLYLENRLKKKK
jgi:hypothetical protein